MEIVVISRTNIVKDGLMPFIKRKVKHLAIISNILPHGIWEVGPDSQWNTATTNTINRLNEWGTNLDTKMTISLEGEQIKKTILKVNQQGLLNAINLY